MDEEGERGFFQEHRKIILAAGFGAFVLFALLLFRGCCVTFVDNYELAYRYDLRGGRITHLNRTGYIMHLPIVVEIHTVDLRPTQVCINANSRVLNCKLVQFDPAGLDLFLSWHGRADYETARSSLSDSSSPTPFNGILMSYAFDGSGKHYPFLHVIRELKPEEGGSAQVPKP